jgi:chromosome segregation ATPase
VNSAIRFGIVMLTFATGVGLGVYGARLRGEREADFDRRAALQARIAVLDGRARALEEQAAALREQAVQQSNALRVVEGRYQEERQTHEPLRLQIEKMQMQKISDDGRLRKQADEAKRLHADLDKARDEARTNREDSRALRGQLAQAEVARQEATRSVDEARERLKAAETRSGELERRVKELETGLAAAQAAREEVETRRVALAAELEAVRRPAAASTNAPPAEPAAETKQQQ